MLPAITIANLALSHLGEKGSLSSLSPPEGSAWAQVCATFYQAALDMLLTRHDWGFITTRERLALVSKVNPQWRFIYARPTGAIKILSVFAENATDDALSVTGDATARFITESLTDGTPVILSHLETAWARYTKTTTDATKFPQPFCLALSYQLAAMLAGPIIKGDTGRAVSKAMLEMSEAYAQEAKRQDAAEGKHAKPEYMWQNPWLSAR